jgi:hypothetical protein
MRFCFLPLETTEQSFFMGAFYSFRPMYDYSYLTMCDFLVNAGYDASVVSGDKAKEVFEHFNTYQGLDYYGRKGIKIAVPHGGGVAYFFITDVVRHMENIYVLRPLNGEEWAGFFDE